jgi:hypothetical protein
MEFGLIKRRHHCRACGGIFCSSCSLSRDAFPHLGYHEPVRCCNPCATIMHEQRQRPARGPPAQAETSGAPPAHAEKGTRVRVFGLEAKPEYNDQMGTVTLWDDARKRAGVLLDSGTKVALKPANLRAAIEPPAAAAQPSSSELPPAALAQPSSELPVSAALPLPRRRSAPPLLTTQTPAALPAAAPPGASKPSSLLPRGSARDGAIRVDKIYHGSAVMFLLELAFAAAMSELAENRPAASA